MLVETDEHHPLSENVPSPPPLRCVQLPPFVSRQPVRLSPVCTNNFRIRLASVCTRHGFFPSGYH